MTETQNATTLQQTLWNAADILRSKMDANEYKNYMLGLIFYKYLSDKMLRSAADLLEEPTDNLAQAQASYLDAYHDEDTHVIELIAESLDAWASVIFNTKILGCQTRV